MKIYSVKIIQEMYNKDNKLLNELVLYFKMYEFRILMFSGIIFN